MLLHTALATTLLVLADLARTSEAAVRGVNELILPTKLRGLMEDGGTTANMDGSMKDGGMDDAHAAEAEKTYTVLDVVNSYDKFTTLKSAIGLADYSGILSNTSGITFFAPTNDAFSQLPSGVLDALVTPEYGLHLFDLLAYHTDVQDVLFAVNLTDGLEISTIQREGEMIYVSESNSNITLITAASRDNMAVVPDSHVVYADLEGTNGVVHAIDHILMPKFVFSSALDTLGRFDRFSTLLDLIEEADLTDFLKRFSGTFLAPTNDALDAMGDELTKIRSNQKVLRFWIKYHLFPELFNIEYMPEMLEVATVLGPGVIFDPNKLSENDLIRESIKNPKFNDIEISTYYLWSSGVIYEMPTALTPPTLLQAIQNDSKYSMLATAVNASTPLASDILGNRDLLLTMFAPTDKAIDTLPEGVWDTLMLPEYGRHLFDILAYHLHVGDIYLADELEDGMELSTAQKNNETLLLKINDTEICVYTTEARKNGTKVAPAKVNGTDLLAINGVIHDIDSVLLPEFVFQSMLDVLKLYPDKFSILLELIEAVGLEESMESFTGTLLAPTNDALMTLGEDTLAALKNDTEKLTKILSYHLIPTVNTLILGIFSELYTLYGPPVLLTSDKPSFNDIESKDYYLFGAGIIYELDGVLELPNVAKVIDLVADFSTMQVALDTAGLTNALGNPDETFTVFAPINTAFASLPNSLLDSYLKPDFGLHLFDLLAYHIAVGYAIFTDEMKAGLDIPTLQRQGETLLVNITEIYEVEKADDSKDKSHSKSHSKSKKAEPKAGGPEPKLIGRLVFLITAQGRIDAIVPTQIVQPDYAATNGVVHGVDRVLLPQFVYLNATSTLLRFSGQFSTLTDLLVIAGLDGSISSMKGTLLAPNNDALANICVKSDSRRMKSKSKKEEAASSCIDVSTLVTLLSYHVIPDYVFNFEIGEEGQTLQTLLENTVSVSYQTSANVAFNGVDSFDYYLFVSGIVYELDGFLLPST
jgi:uncharacterized surface protein with fasciclin (FAS1) repeats